MKFTPTVLSIMLSQDSTAGEVQNMSLPGSAGLQDVADVDERTCSSFFADEVDEDGRLLVKSLESGG